MSGLQSKRSCRAELAGDSERQKTTRGKLARLLSFFAVRTKAALGGFCPYKRGTQVVKSKYRQASGVVGFLRSKKGMMLADILYSWVPYAICTFKHVHILQIYEDPTKSAFENIGKCFLFNVHSLHLCCFADAAIKKSSSVIVE